MQDYLPRLTAAECLVVAEAAERAHRGGLGAAECRLAAIRTLSALFPYVGSSVIALHASAIVLEYLPWLT